MIARVFPRKTSASPEDSHAYFGAPPVNGHVYDEVHVSCTWIEDRPRAEELADAWGRVAPTKIGGPAYDDKGGDFVSGKYIKRGYVITSRGCPNSCWFCHAWKREGRQVRELPIVDGFNVLDSNLLACSERHIRDVFKMLGRQQERAEFTGGLEANRLRDWHINLLWSLRPGQMFFAYDTPDDKEPLEIAGRMLYRADFTRRHCRCYVLIGYPGDTFAMAESRLLDTWSFGFMPSAMLWQDGKSERDEDWRKLQRQWMRPVITRNHVRDLMCAAGREEW